MTRSRTADPSVDRAAAITDIRNDAFDQVGIAAVLKHATKTELSDVTVGRCGPVRTPLSGAALLHRHRIEGLELLWLAAGLPVQ